MRVHRDREPYSNSQHKEASKAMGELQKMINVLRFEGLDIEADAVKASLETLKARMLLYYQT